MRGSGSVFPQKPFFLHWTQWAKSVLERRISHIRVGSAWFYCEPGSRRQIYCEFMQIWIQDPALTTFSCEMKVENLSDGPLRKGCQSVCLVHIVALRTFKSHFRFFVIPPWSCVMGVICLYVVWWNLKPNVFPAIFYVGKFCFVLENVRKWIFSLISAYLDS